MIRHLLMCGMALLTRHDRYMPKIEWSKGKCLTHDLFRCWEFVFGRRYGIRRESASSVWVDEEGKHHVDHSFFTVEASMAYTEGVIREVAYNILIGNNVYLPQAAIASVLIALPFLEIKLPGSSMFAPFFAGAIGRDASSQGSTSAAGTTATVAHTCSGSDRILVIHGNNVLLSNTLSSVTYNGVSCAHIARFKYAAGDRFSDGSLLVAPATGTNNIVWTWSPSGSNQRGGVSISYTGAKQTGQPDAFAKTEQANATSITSSPTVVATDCWMVCMLLFYNCVVGSESPSGANAGRIQGITDFAVIGDSNGVIGTGAVAAGWTYGATTLNAMLNVSIAPAPAATRFFSPGGGVAYSPTMMY